MAARKRTAGPSKRCPRCTRTLPRTAYYHSPSGQIAGYCEGCRKVVWREWHAKVRARFAKGA